MGKVRSVGAWLMSVGLLSAAGCQSGTSKDPLLTVYLPVSAKIKGMDPAFANDLYSGREISYVYEGLVQYHYLKRPYVLEPSLAASMPKISSDRKTLTFAIRKGVLFHDDPCFTKSDGKGRELVAEDFVYTIKRIADPRIMSTGWWVYDDRIEGLNDWRAEASKADITDYSKPVVGLKAVDRYTLEIKLTRPSTQFLFYLAMPSGWVVPKESVDTYGSDFARSPVGTGPFVYSRKESNLGSKLVYYKNPTYHHVTYPTEGAPGDREAGLLEDAGKALPMIDKLVTEVHVEQQPMWLNFMSGKLDWLEIPKDNFEQAIGPNKDLVSELKVKGMQLVKSTEFDLTHISFNLQDPILGKSKELRQAMSLAYNRIPLIDLFYNGRAIPAQGPIPPGLNGYDPKSKNPYGEYHIAKAKDLLTKAGYPGGQGLPVFEYASQATSTDRQMAEYFASSMAQIGIKIRTVSYTWPEFISGVNNRKHQIFGWAWQADYPDAENFLQMFYSKNGPPGPNDSNYNNPEIDQMYEQALTLPDGPIRTGIYKGMTRKITEDAPWIFGVHRMKFQLTQRWIKNFKDHAFEHSRAKYLRVATEMKTDKK